MQRTGRIIGSLRRVGFPWHQDAGVLPAESFRIVDPRDGAGPRPQREPRAGSRLKNPCHLMRRVWVLPAADPAAAAVAAALTTNACPPRPKIVNNLSLAT